MRNCKDVYNKGARMTDVVIATVRDEDTKEYYWRVICMSGEVEASFGERADAESYCNDAGYTYEIFPVRKYTANLLAANTMLRLHVIEDRKLDLNFDMRYDVTKARQAIRDYCAKYRITVLNRASFNWSI